MNWYTSIVFCQFYKWGQLLRLPVLFPGPSKIGATFNGKGEPLLEKTLSFMSWPQCQRETKIGMEELFPLKSIHIASSRDNNRKSQKLIVVEKQ